MTAQQLTGQYADELGEYSRLVARLQAVCDRHAGIPNNAPPTPATLGDKLTATAETFIDRLNQSGKTLVATNADFRGLVNRLEEFFMSDAPQLASGKSY